MIINNFDLAAQYSKTQHRSQNDKTTFAPLYVSQVEFTALLLLNLAAMCKLGKNERKTIRMR